MTGVAIHEGRSSFQVVVGVDTHRDKHVAVAIDLRGVRLGEFHTPTTTHGYGDLERWSLGLGEIRAFGIEGTGCPASTRFAEFPSISFAGSPPRPQQSRRAAGLHQSDSWGRRIPG